MLPPCGAQQCLTPHWGNLGGFAGPYVVGWAKQATNSFTGGLYALAALTLAGAIVAFFAVKVHKPAVAKK